MKKTYAIVNFLSVLLVLAVNGLSQAQRWNDTTIGEASDKYENLFTPAGYAFSIWGVIFLMLLGYSLFQIRRAFFSKKNLLSLYRLAGGLLLQIFLMLHGWLPLRMNT